MERTIIATCKDIIDTGDLESLKDYYASLQNTIFEFGIPWEYIYQQVYLHACLKKQIEIVSWLQTIYERFGMIEKIALRQMFSYGNYLLNKKNESN